MTIISTKRVDCKDCHRCVRTCPTKAISVEKGQARIIEERCILCGVCVRSCPQHAKVVMDSTKTVMGWLAAQEQVAISLAPSFPAAFPLASAEQIMAALQKVGFTIVEETAVGAQVVASHYRNYIEDEKRRMTISSCCPVVVNMLEQYFPTLLPALSPTLSPMVTHAKMLRERNEDIPSKVVFAGPCFAKITEAEQHGYVDAVLTFQQLKQILERKGIDPAEISIADATREYTAAARLFPISHGVLKTFLAPGQVDAHDIISVDGINDCFELFQSIEHGEMQPRFVEAMACSNGCVNGPGMEGIQSTATRRARVLKFAQDAKGEVGQAVERVNITRTFTDRSAIYDVPSEQQIREILAQTRKFTKADEKNCGGCGYETCREKAIAVARGLAEVEMCLPYMRMRAESVSNIIVNFSLNGMIVVDEKMIIREFNPAAERLFRASSEQLRGVPLSLVLGDEHFSAAARTNKPIRAVRVEYPQFDLITEQNIIPVKQHGIVIGIIMDVTERERKANELEKVKNQAIQKATEIVNKQMLVAQEIAGLLGETTAETKAALLELVYLYRGKEGR